jgi:hypothetical protein
MAGHRLLIEELWMTRSDLEELLQSIIWSWNSRDAQHEQR